MTEDRYKQLRVQALNLLARREHSQHELVTKLSGRSSLEDADSEQANGALIVEVVTRLAEEGLQSDSRFCESFMAMRKRKGYGPQRIRQELQQRGISAALIEQELVNEHDWFEAARSAWEKKFGISGGIDRDRKEQARQWRFLQYRGFNSEQTAYAMNPENE